MSRGGFYTLRAAVVADHESLHLHCRRLWSYNVCNAYISLFLDNLYEE